MAKNTTVWGIDIGNSSLKAIRCRESEEPGKIEALAFDYIEHSKILSQPGAEPAEILAETLQTFLSRNSTKGDKVAISVNGQNTISRFLRLPPVDPKKVGDILKYEARQWLPFALEDVIWDFQPLGADSGTDGLLDSEIGMFAMKKDVAMRSLTPYLNAGVDVDVIQSAPLSIYNYVTYDQLRTAANDYQLDPDNPPEHVIILSVGTDASDIIITNGFSIWIRTIVNGGNNFTKALTKGLKLTFSKAEYLKRNAAAAQDPKAVFQAMRPVFNEMLTEVHRSIEYYQSINRRAKFSKVLALGNAMKMPGLRQFLAQNLGYEVIRVANFNRIVGQEVIAAPLFKENMVSFGVAYGLALQALEEAPLSTNLIPQDVVTERIIREKKPWALALCATLMLAMTCWFAGASRSLETVKRGDYAPAESKAQDAMKHAADLQSKTSQVKGQFTTIDGIGTNLTVSVEGRNVWTELLKLLNVCLPVDKTGILDAAQGSRHIERQERIFITNIDAINCSDLTVWFELMKKHELYFPDDEEIEDLIRSGATLPEGITAPDLTLADNPQTPGAEEGDEEAEGAAAPEGPSPEERLTEEIRRVIKKMTESQKIAMIAGPESGTAGKIVQMVGYHYHNGDPDSLMGGAYVRERLLRPLKGYGHEYGEVLEIEFPAGMRKRLRDPGATEKATMKELGIGYPTLVYAPRAEETIIMDPKEILKLHEKTELERLKRRGPGMSAGPSSSAGSSGPSGYSRSGGGGGAEIDPFRLDTNALLTSSGSGRGARGGSGFDLTQLPPEARISLRKFDFIIQFSWVETYPSTREKAREEAALKKAQEEGLAPAEGEEGEEAAVPSPTDTVSTPSTPVEPVAEENPEATTEDTEEMTEPETPDSSAETDESASTDSEDAP